MQRPAAPHPVTEIATIPPTVPDSQTAVTTPQTASRPLLAWRVHLLRRDPSRLPALLMILLLAVSCVWMMFGALLPVLAAVLLLLGAAGEYLFPISYQITADGVFANTLAGRNALPWKEARRCWRERGGLVLTPLAKPTRLDAFRGVLVRFAPDGQPGDSASVLEAIRRCAPGLIPETNPAAPLQPSQES